MKKCSTSLVLKEMQIKLQYNTITDPPVELYLKTVDPICSQGCGTLTLSDISSMYINWEKPKFEHMLTILKIYYCIKQYCFSGLKSQTYILSLSVGQEFDSSLVVWILAQGLSWVCSQNVSSSEDLTTARKFPPKIVRHTTISRKP